MGYIETPTGRIPEKIHTCLITIWDILKRRKAVIEVVHRHSLITIWDILKQDKGPRTLEESIV